ncbi:MAG: DNA ligase D, partial [Flavisolibacter sp.]
MRRKKTARTVSSKQLQRIPAKTGGTKRNVKKPVTSLHQFSAKDLFGDHFNQTEEQEHSRFIPPMQATRIEEPFNDPKFIYEIKWDGYRIIAKVEGGKVKLFSRSGLDYTSKYPPIAHALSRLEFDAIIDGEVVVLDEDGKPNFDSLQRYQEGDPILFYAFDLLWLKGYSMLNMPLENRKKMLEKLVTNSNLIRISETFDDGVKLFEAAQAHKLEGIVAKEKSSIYEPGQRVKTWYKIPTEVRQEFVIGGWTESESGRSFRSLLFGYFEKEKFIFAGHAGGGYKESEMPKMLARLKKLETKNKPFEGEVDTDTNVHWVRPQLVAEFKYATLTASGKIRKPAIFLGFREDKKAKDVVREVDLPKEENTSTIEKPKNSKIKTSADSNWPELEKQKITSHTEHEFEGKKVELINIDKRLWGDFTKAHLLMYYHSVFPFIQPHLSGRPLSLHIKPNGPAAPGLYIKDMEGRQPGWAEIFTVPRKHKTKGKRDTIDYLVCNDEATLQYIINLGCIDINPWTSRTVSPEHPDFIIVDLDPSDDDFTKAIEAANAARQVFEKHRVNAFPKTSGKTGVHLYLPCSGFSFGQARTIAENICEEVHKLVPSITTTDVSINNRGNKLYLDPN